MRAECRVVAVVPAFNEASTILDIVERTRQHVDEIIVVDDGSNDGTPELLTGSPVHLIRHATNRGKGASLLDGFRAAVSRGATLVVTLDADGQHRPEDITALVDCAHRNPGKIVIGSRLADRASFPSARYQANEIANFWISWASGYRIEDSQSGFRVYPRGFLEHLPARYDRRKGFALESELLIDAARAGRRSVPVPIPALYSETHRPSHFRPVLDITRIVIMVAGKLLSRGMYPRGLLNSLRERRRVDLHAAQKTSGQNASERG
jgi:glycosyltransferase involved in cell wall biosynthesis